MIKTLTIMGTRPEAIKLAPLVKALNAHDSFKNVLCVTAQHRQMLDQVLELFEIKPDIDLDLMMPNQDLFSLTASIISSIKGVINDIQPDLVFVQGDTTTAMVSALGCFYACIPVAHVEAGLRTGNLMAPFPEEANRCLTSRLVTFHFCPTQMNMNNLIKEGIDPSIIQVTGNTVIDALFWVRDRIAGIPPETMKNYWGNAAEAVSANSPIVLVTCHRRENFGQGLKNICLALVKLASSHIGWHFIFPVHLNPNVRGPVGNRLSGISNIHLINPLDYAPFVYLMNRSRIILTDSGGVQEEGPSLGKPILVMRETTERPEAVLSGTVRLVGTKVEGIVQNVENLINDKIAYRSMSQAINPYGDGNAAPRIIKFILDRMNK